MLNAINKHGLPRSRPAAVDREIRQRSGFGCVICGSGIYEYEHVDPLWVDAKEHNPDNMTLLCMQCHGKKTRGMLSVETIRKAMANPKSKQRGFASEMFDFNDEQPLVIFASNKFENCRTIIQVNGNPLFTIAPPEQPGSPFRLSAEIYDSDGGKSLFIIDNEWKAFNSNWDVTTEGPVITIREKLRWVSLVIRVHPPSLISIEKLTMKYQNWTFDGDNTKLIANGVELSGNKATNCKCAMVFGY